MSAAPLQSVQLTLSMESSRSRTGLNAQPQIATADKISLMSRPHQPDGRVHGIIVGCRRPDGRWLLIRRSAAIAAAPLKVCFPGGALEIGELRQEAAVREVREELGVEVDLVGEIWNHVFEQRKLVLWGYLGRLQSYDLTPNPQEVEEILLTCPGVAEAAVVGVSDEERGEMVKAFFVMESKKLWNPDAINAWCQANLAAHKRP